MVVIAAALLGAAGGFFPPGASFDMSQAALERLRAAEGLDAGPSRGHIMRVLQQWALTGMGEPPLWRSGREGCRVVALLHRSFLVLRLQRTKGTGGMLVAKVYVQGTSDQGVGVTRSRTLPLADDVASRLLGDFRSVPGLWSNRGLQRNEAIRDGQFDPLNGIVLLECARGDTYGLTLFEPPLPQGGVASARLAADLDALLKLFPVDFFPEHLHDEIQ